MGKKYLKALSGCIIERCTRCRFTLEISHISHVVCGVQLVNVRENVYTCTNVQHTPDAMVFASCTFVNADLWYLLKNANEMKLNDLETKYIEGEDE